MKYNKIWEKGKEMKEFLHEKKVMAQTPTLSIYPSEVEVLEGNNFRVSINVTDVTDLWAWQANISFNPSQVNFTGATEGPFLRRG